MARRAQAAKRESRTGRLRPWLAAAGKGAAGALLLGLLVAAVNRLTDPAALPVRSVAVRGSFGHVGQRALADTIRPYLKAGLLRLDMDGLRGALEGLAWVQRASLRRIWPDALEVTVEEQRPLARWAAGGVVSETGELFRPERLAGLESLPVFEGPEGASGELAKGYRAIQRMLVPLRVRATRLAVSERGAWQVRLDNGLELKLGRRDTDRRLLRFVRSYAGAIAPRLERIDSVDLRYTNGFAVRWKTGMAPQA